MSGQFDVLVDNKLVFSRYDTGRFPEIEDILPLLSGTER
jgi:hypothetical protein